MINPRFGRRGTTKKRNFKSTGIGLSILLSAAVLLIACPAVAPDTRYVSKTGSNEPPYTTPETAARTIQAALDASFIADVVMVDPGDYEESISIRQDGIVLVGAGRDQCRIIVPDGEESAGIAAMGYGLEMHGLAVLGGAVGVSLAAEYGPVLIADCLIEKAKGVGLSIGERGTVHVVDSVFRGANTGIHVRWHEEEYLYTQVFAFGCEFLDNGTGIDGSGICVLSATECSFLRNGYGMFGGWGAVILVDSSRFEEGTSGIVAMTADGVVRVSNSVFVFMSWEAIETDQTGVVTDSLFYANDRAFDEWDGGYKPDFLRCTFVSNQTALGRMPNVVRDCIFWNNGRDLPEFPDGGWPQTRIIEHCLINDPRFAGKDGNVSGNPLFVGWGSFNGAENPIHVDSSAFPGGNGSLEHPFVGIQDAVRRFDFHLCEGSPCLGGGASGGDIAYPAGVAPSSAPRSDSVAIEMAPGHYPTGRLIIPGGITAYGKQTGGPRPCLVGEVAILEGARARELDFLDSVVRCQGGDVRGCNFRLSSLCVYAGSASLCRVLQGAVFLGGIGSATISNSLIVRNGDVACVTVAPGEACRVEHCTLSGGSRAIHVYGLCTPSSLRLRNSIVVGEVTGFTECLEANHSLFPEGWPGEGNVTGDPRFVDAENGDFRLRADSPCIDAGFNDPELPEFDIAGMHRIMFGGKSLTVDMGAYEFYINKLEPVPGINEAVFTWSSLADKTYSIFYTDDLFNWHLAIANFHSSGSQTTSWLDDGSLTGIPPLLAPKRFYRLLENP